MKEGKVLLNLRGFHKAWHREALPIDFSVKIERDENSIQILNHYYHHHLRKKQQHRNDNFFFSKTLITSFLILLPVFDYLEIIHGKQVKSLYCTMLIFQNIPFNRFCTSWVSDYITRGKHQDLTPAIERYRFNYTILNGQGKLLFFQTPNCLSFPLQLPASRQLSQGSVCRLLTPNPSSSFCDGENKLHSTSNTGQPDLLRIKIVQIPNPTLILQHSYAGLCIINVFTIKKIEMKTEICKILGTVGRTYVKEGRNKQKMKMHKFALNKIALQPCWHQGSSTLTLGTQMQSHLLISSPVTTC